MESIIVRPSQRAPAHHKPDGKNEAFPMSAIHSERFVHLSVPWPCHDAGMEGRVWV